MQQSGYISYIWLVLFIVTVILLYRSFKSDGTVLADRESKYCTGFFIISIVVSILLFSFDSTRNQFFSVYIVIALVTSGVFAGGLGLGFFLVLIIKTSPSEKTIKRTEMSSTTSQDPEKMKKLRHEQSRTQRYERLISGIKSDDVKFQLELRRIQRYEESLKRVQEIQRKLEEIEKVPDSARIQELIKIRKMIREAIHPRPFSPQQKIIRDVLDVVQGVSRPPSTTRTVVDELESTLFKIESELSEWIIGQRNPIINAYREKEISAEEYINRLLQLQKESGMDVWAEGFHRLDLESTVATVVQAVDEIIAEGTPESRFFLGYLLNNTDFRDLLINVYRVPWNSDCWPCGKEEDYYACIVHHKIIDALTQHEDAESIAALYTYITTVILHGEENYVPMNDDEVNFVFTSKTAFRKAIDVVAKDPEYNPKVLAFLLELDEKWNRKNPLTFRLFLIRIIGDIWKEKALPLIKHSLWQEYIESQALDLGVKIAAKHDDEQKSIEILKELLSSLVKEIHWDPNDKKYLRNITYFVSDLKEARPDASDILKKTLDTYPELFEESVFSAFQPILTLIAPKESKEWWRYFFIQLSRDSYDYCDMLLDEISAIEPSILSDILKENEEDMKRGIDFYLSSINLEFNRYGSVLVDFTKNGILDSHIFKSNVFLEIYRIASKKSPHFSFVYDINNLIYEIKKEKLMDLEEYQWKDLEEMMNLVVRLLLLDGSEKSEVARILDLFLSYYEEVQQHYSFESTKIQENIARIKDVYENDKLNLINEVFHSIWDYNDSAISEKN